jgi:hypothetical protein
MIAEVKNKMEAVKVIYNNDCKILDFLADMQDREPLKALQRFIDFSHHEPICLLHNCPLDDIVILIVYKEPFGFNMGDNRMVLFVYNDLAGLYDHFDKWRHGNIPASQKVNNSDVYKAIDEILGLISHELINRSHDDNVLSDFLG